MDVAKPAVKVFTYLITVFIILVVFFSIWRQIEDEAIKSAALVATKQMLESVNRLKQEWLLQGQPSNIFYNGRVVAMTETGLVESHNLSKEFDCALWLAIHYPHGKIYDARLLHIESKHINDTYQCRFVYQHDVSILMTKNKRFVKIIVEKT